MSTTNPRTPTVRCTCGEQIDLDLFRYEMALHICETGEWHRLPTRGWLLFQQALKRTW